MPVYQPVRALERGLAVLQTVNAHDGIRTPEIAKATGLSRPTVFRLLETLEAQGFVTRSASGGGWHPTLSCHLLSSGFIDKSWIGHIAMPEMVRLGKEILWPLDLMTLDGDAMLVRESTHRLSPFSFDVGMIGARLPILLTSGGHSYLSFCPDDEREIILDILRRSDKPENALAHDAQTIQQILNRTRARGFGFRTEGFRDHTHSISVPIFKEGRIIASLSVICLRSAISFEDMVRQFEPPMRRTCETLGKEIDRWSEGGGS